MVIGCLPGGGFQVRVQRGRQQAFGQMFLEFADQSVVAQQRRACLVALQHLVDQCVINARLGALCHGGPFQIAAMTHHAKLLAPTGLLAPKSHVFS